MAELDAFRTLVRSEGARHGRDFPWRRTRDPYAIWISEVMLQQTQTVRVEARWGAWLERFPTVRSLAGASTADVLQAWQGMGYNRRALALKAAAEEMERAHGGEVPSGLSELVALPGIGPATAQGIRSFAFDLPGVYLETNVRTVFLHQLFPDAEGVTDRALTPLVEATCPAGEGAPAPSGGGPRYAAPQDSQDTPRTWYYALLDYGAFLKKAVPNPSRRSSTYKQQGRFEGSHRQKRAEMVRILLAADAPASGGVSAEEAARLLSDVERAAGRSPVDEGLAKALLEELAGEGFCLEAGGRWSVA